MAKKTESKKSNTTNTPEKLILAQFEKISAIPRKSRNEEKIREYLSDWAKIQDFKSNIDDAGNIIIKVPGKNGLEKKPPVILQGHMDMVCEKTPDSKHDFSKDPIKFVFDGEWLKADKTTLGADNGIAIAVAMAIAEDKSLINIDSEDEGVFTVGCAGGKDTKIELTLQYEEVPADFSGYILKSSGMTGGHSGVNIHEERANAIKVVTRALHIIRERTDIRLVNLQGGTAHNAIPRDAKASFFAPPSAQDFLPKLVKEIEAMFKNEYANTDPHLKIELSYVDSPPDRRAMMSYFTAKVIDFLLAIPNGVAARSTDMPEIVETSSNHARTWIADGKIWVETSQRSSVMSRLEGITKRIEAISRLCGARVVSNEGYPSWQPNFKSNLLAHCKKCYKKLYGKEPKVEAIHAGLECGLIGNVQPGMDMISLGPTIKNPHSPDEKIFVPSIEKIWNLLLEILSTM
jgi:dipeptidase D